MIFLLIASSAQAADVASAALSDGWTPAAVATLLLAAVLFMVRHLLTNHKTAIAHRDKLLDDANKAHVARENALLACIDSLTEAVSGMASNVHDIADTLEGRGLPR